MNKNALKRQQRKNLRSGSHAMRGVSSPRNESSLPKKSKVKPLTPREEEWREKIETVRQEAKRDSTRRDSLECGVFKDGTPKFKLKKMDDREFAPTPEHLIGVETHPVPEFAKSRNYPHQKLQNPSHLWCDEVHATDADVRKGNAKR